MKNTRKVIILVLILFISGSTYSQYSHFGMKGGLNLSNMTVEGNNDNNLKYGFHIGVFNKMMITEYFALQPELLYSTKGFKNNFDENLIADGEAQFNLNYIDLPVKLVYNLSEDFAFQFGPYISYLASANVETDAEVLDFFDIDSEEELDRENFNALDYGLTAGLDFLLEPVILGFNYNLGLRQVAKEDKISKNILGDAKNTVIKVYAGIYF